MDNQNKKIDLTNEMLDPECATKQELNAEATMRANTDAALSEDLNDLRKNHNKKIEDISIVVKENEGKIDDLNVALKEDESKIGVLEEKVGTAEGNIETNDGRIANLEVFFLDRIKELESKNEELSSRLNDANQLVGQKDDEIARLIKELKDTGAPNVINLKFAEVQKFTLTEIISVKEFINNFLKSLVVPKMEMRYPEAQFNQDYTLAIEGLNYHDVMQGKNMVVIIKALADGNLIGESSFAIKINYQYDAEKQAKFVDELLKPAIPTSLIDVPETAAANHRVPDEIINTRPLRLLLQDKDFKHLTFKIFGEMNAASYWTDFHRPWQYIGVTYGGTGQSTIGGGLIINNAAALYNSTSTYHDSIYKIIEQRLNDSGVPCTIIKKYARTNYNAGTLHALGNLIFNVPNSNLDNDEIIFTPIRNYYMMINFEVNINQVKKFYRGVTLVMTDKVELY